MILRGCIAVLALAAATAFAQQRGVQGTEAQIKAAFLYQFGGFVEWPPRAFASPGSPFTIGVLGAEAIASELEQVVAGRTVQGRPIAVRKLRRGEPLAGLHVLFIGRSETSRLGEILASGLESALIVTESDNALSQGSMINFVAVGDKMRFDVALPSAERGNLRISARLLSVARKVITSS